MAVKKIVNIFYRLNKSEILVENTIFFNFCFDLFLKILNNKIRIKNIYG